MSGLEIERKFIVSKAKAFKSLAFAHQTIKQGYIPCQDATVRIRTKGDKSFLTIKSRSVDGGLSRYEFEKEITHEEAENLFKLCKGGMIEKERFFIEYTGKDGKHYIFEFVRPEIIQDVGHIDSPTASIGMFMLQWLDAHNQGDDFDILKMRLVDFLAVAKLFGEKMFGVLFETKFKCAKCKKQNTQEFGISLKDLVDILNEI